MKARVCLGEGQYISQGYIFHNDKFAAYVCYKVKNREAPMIFVWKYWLS